MTGGVACDFAARTKAVRTTIHEMAQKGIPAFVDRSGREWSPEAYVNMDIRATVKNTALEAKFSVMDSLGQDVFEVSSHPGSRPKCRPWQGKLISRSGKTTEITDLHGRKHKVIPLSQTSFGEPDGLFGINCGHRPRGCSEGVFTKSAVEYDDEEDKELYNKVCRQRELERRVRKSKTEADMLEAAGDTEGAKEVRQKMSEQNKALLAYCEDNGLKYRSDRVRTYGSVKPDSDKERRSAITSEMNRPTVKPEIKQSRFIPAQTIQEAEEFAGRYIETRLGDKTFKGMADFKGVSLEHSNDINRALSDVFDKYDIPKISGIKAIDPNSAKGKKIFTSADAVMAYSPVEHGVYINKSVLKNPEALAAYNRQAQQAWNTVMDNIDSLTGAQREIALRYKNAGRSLVGDGSAHDYFVHEMGHHIQWEAFDAKTNNAVGSRMSQYAGGISGYATASKSEYFAESFAAFEKGELDKLDPDFVAFLRGKSLDKSAGSGIIKADSEPSRFRFDKMTSEQRKEVIQKGVSVKKPVFSYDRPDNQAMSRLQRTVPMADNVFDVISHGSATTIEFFKQDFPDSDIRGHIDAFTLSCILKSRSDYKAFIKACKQKGVEPYVRLLSCRTGDTTDTGNCFGQLLANELGIKVYAPNDEILVKHNGLFDIGEHRDGDMILFYPRK